MRWRSGNHYVTVIRSAFRRAVVLSAEPNIGSTRRFAHGEEGPFESSLRLI